MQLAPTRSLRLGRARGAVAIVVVGCGGGGGAPVDGLADADADAVTTCATQPGWIDAPALARGPTQETATVAVDGKIYVLGGFDEALGVIAAVQVFDTTTCAWTSGPPLPRPVHHANAVVVGDAIYVVGAMETLNFTSVGHVWSWRPATEAAWTTHPMMPTGTERGAAVAGALGTRIVLAGGLRGGAIAEVIAYDTVNQTWDLTLPSLPSPRDHACGGVVGDTLYVVGGRGGAIGAITGAVEAFTGTAWEARSSMLTARGGTACGVIADRLLVVGGEGNAAVGSGVFPQAETYAPATDSWQPLADMPVPRHGMGAAAWAGSLYVPGGATQQGFGAVATHAILTP